MRTKLLRPRGAYRYSCDRDRATIFSASRDAHHGAQSWGRVPITPSTPPFWVRNHPTFLPICGIDHSSPSPLHFIPVPERTGAHGVSEERQAQATQVRPFSGY